MLIPDTEIDLAIVDLDGPLLTTNVGYNAGIQILAESHWFLPGLCFLRPVVSSYHSMFLAYLSMALSTNQILSKINTVVSLSLLFVFIPDDCFKINDDE